MTSPQIGSGKSIFDETSPSPSASADASVSPSASPSSGAAASEEPINNLNPGASETQVDDYVEKLPNDNDPKGSSFGFIFGRQKKVTKNAITITWKKPSKVDHFVIYGAKCGKKNRYQKITTVKGKSYTQKNLPKGTYHKYLVSAFDSSGTLLGVSNTIHIVTKGGKYCNFKKITTGVKKNKITLAKKGKSAKIKGKAYKENKKLKASVHRPVRYESSNKKVATVNNKGKVVAKKKGKCKIYVFAQNGAYKTVKVTVKK
ncbi:MAG: Ig-like domain-containing protein [Lachnospiraceae bacterium]|nr:Ig-like domain-containing protein [Lachnospiraceae bacterium]